MHREFQSVFSIYEIAVCYHFTNKLFSREYQQLTADGWKEIVKVLIETVSEKKGSQYYIDNEKLYHELSTGNPEEFEKTKDYFKPSNRKEILASITDYDVSILDISSKLKITLIVNSIDEIMLFEQLLITNFPTFHINDAKIATESIPNRIPISIVPHPELEYIALSGDEELIKECRDCGFNDIISVNLPIHPSRQTVNELIRGHVLSGINNCTHDYHTRIQALTEKYQKSNVLNNYTDEINEIVQQLS